MADAWLKTRKIAHLPGTKLTPEVVLARTLEKAPRIKSVVVVVMWDDDTFDTDWSQMQVSEFCMASKILDKEVGSRLVPDDDEGKG